MGPNEQEVLQLLIKGGVPEFKARLALDIAKQARKVAGRALFDECKKLSTGDVAIETLSAYLAMSMLFIDAEEASELLPTVVAAAAMTYS